MMNYDETEDQLELKKQSLIDAMRLEIMVEARARMGLGNRLPIFQAHWGEGRDISR